MNVLSLFSGIGGLELGLERAGMTVVGQVELDDYCRRVLAKHWPEVPRHDDVRTAVKWWLDPNTHCRGCQVVAEPNGDATRPAQQASQRSHPHGLGHVEPPPIDVICGGFPCQDISNAGRRAGITGTRSGLWSYMADAVRVLRPRYVVMENVSALLVRGLDVVTADLSACGYDVQWDCIPAAAVGAPHRRDRWWGIATDTHRGDLETGRLRHRAGAAQPRSSSRGTELAYANGSRRNGRAGQPRTRGWRQPTHSSWWRTEPDVGRVAHGIPSRVDRLRSLGNAVVPQVAEHAGRLLVEFDAGQVAA